MKVEQDAFATDVLVEDHEAKSLLEELCRRWEADERIRAEAVARETVPLDASDVDRFASLGPRVRMPYDELPEGVDPAMFARAAEAVRRERSREGRAHHASEEMRRFSSVADPSPQAPPGTRTFSPQDAASGHAPLVQPPKFKLIPFDDVKRGSEPAYLVKGLIPKCGLIVAWGPPKCGKSFWTFDLAMHVALGWPYRNRRVIVAVVVLRMRG